MHRALPWIALAAAACGTPDSTTLTIELHPDAGLLEDVRVPADASRPTACAEGKLRLGTGEREFHPVADGDVVPFVRGPLGGWLVYLGVQALGVDPSNASLCYVETLATGARLGSGCWNLQLDTALEGGWHQRVGVWGQLDRMSDPAALRGKDMTLRVVLVDNVKRCTVDANVHIAAALP